MIVGGSKLKTRSLSVNFHLRREPFFPDVCIVNRRLTNFLMKRVLLFLLPVIIVLLFSFSRPPAEGIRINITNLRSNNGHLLISLFKDCKGYPEKAELAVRRGKLVIKDNKAWVVFTGLPEGRYSAAILHDENDDQKMNKTGLGLPKEGYGFSNNVMGAFGPPSCSRASFDFTTGAYKEISIRTRY